MWLVPSDAVLGDSMLGGYQVSTKPDKDGMTYWLGNLHLQADGEWSFSPSEQYAGYADTRHFLYRLRCGRYKITYASGMTAFSRLESERRSMPVARLTLTSKDGASRKAYSVVSDPANRWLRFADPEGHGFEFTAGWMDGQE